MFGVYQEDDSKIEYPENGINYSKVEERKVLGIRKSHTGMKVHKFQLLLWEPITKKAVTLRVK